MKITSNTNVQRLQAQTQSQTKSGDTKSQSGASDTKIASSKAPTTPNDTRPEQAPAATGVLRGGDVSRITGATNQLASSKLGEQVASKLNPDKRVNVGLPSADMHRSGNPTIDSVHAGKDILGNAPGGNITASNEWLTPSQQLDQQAEKNAALFGNRGMLQGGNSAANTAAEHQRLNNRPNQQRGPFDGAPLAGQTDTPTLESFGSAQDNRTKYTSVDMQDVKDGWEFAKEAGWNAATALIGAVSTVAGTALTVATTNMEGKKDEANGIFTIGKWARKEGTGRPQEKLIDDPKVERAPAEHVDPESEDIRNTAPTQETVDRFNAKAGGFTTPGDPMLGGANDPDVRAEAAARILQGQKIGEQSIIRTSADDNSGQQDGNLPLKENPFADPIAPKGGGQGKGSIGGTPIGEGPKPGSDNPFANESNVVSGGRPRPGSGDPVVSELGGGRSPR